MERPDTQTALACARDAAGIGLRIVIALIKLFVSRGAWETLGNTSDAGLRDAAHTDAVLFACLQEASAKGCSACACNAAMLPHQLALHAPAGGCPDVSKTAQPEEPCSVQQLLWARNQLLTLCCLFICRALRGGEGS
jgi:hypothetical protein